VVLEITRIILEKKEKPMPFYLDVLFDDPRLMIVCALNIVINMLTLTTNASRVAGAESKRIATSLSLYNLFQTSFRMLNLIYAPLLASMVDILSGTGRIDLILIKLRFVVFSAALGSIIGFVMLPTFIEVYKQGIKGMEKFGSVPRGILNLIKTPRYWLLFFQCLRKPSFLGVNPGKVQVIPRWFLMFNVFGVSMWTIGVISANYASALNPELVRTTLNLSGVVNGIGTVFLFILVDPVSSLIMDQSVSGDRPIEHVKIMVIWLAIGSVIGNLLGLFLLEPAARYIIWASKFIM
jgi:hypothetical protein